ncbi:MAG: hypothetical protein J6X97_10355 [Lachnospiraceae bacterium]|nr:hypothetical protein [Lachnospiraceae bacterium]
MQARTDFVKDICQIRLESIIKESKLKSGNVQNIVPRSVRACVGITTSIIHIRFLLVFFIKLLAVFAPHFN